MNAMGINNHVDKPVLDAFGQASPLIAIIVIEFRRNREEWDGSVMFFVL